MTMVNGTTEKKHKHEPNKSTLNMSHKLSKALVRLLHMHRTSITEEAINVLIANHTEKDLQEAIHWVRMCNAPLEVIQLLLDSAIENKMVPEKDNIGQLPIHYAFGGNSPI